MTNPIKLKNPSVADLKKQIEELLTATRFAEANVAVQDIERRLARLEKNLAAESEEETELLWPSLAVHNNEAEE